MFQKVEQYHVAQTVSEYDSLQTNPWYPEKETENIGRYNTIKIKQSARSLFFSKLIAKLGGKNLQCDQQ